MSVTHTKKDPQVTILLIITAAVAVFVVISIARQLRPSPPPVDELPEPTPGEVTSQPSTLRSTSQPWESTSSHPPPPAPPRAVARPAAKPPRGLEPSAETVQLQREQMAQLRQDLVTNAEDRRDATPSAEEIDEMEASGVMIW